jgi:serine protease Do
MMFARRWHLFAAAVLLLSGTTLEAQQPERPTLTQLSRSLREITAQVAPAIVEISLVALGPVQSTSGTAEVGTLGRSGSGILVSSDGYILTNAHVVENATAAEVLLVQPAEADVPGRSIVAPVGLRLPATIVGRDAETDLAVLKVDGIDLPYVELADSDSLFPGDLVLAFGSPLGLESSVTMGIVSAIGRQLEADAPVVYIQTDAPINPGNSGGALVDASGRVVGINTLIASPTGVNAGIGFALPSNIARTVYEQIRSYGRVRRGVIGVEVQTVTPPMVKGLRLPRDWGVIVSDVLPGSPAERAGLRAGDIIVAMGGKPMENARQFTVNLYQHAPSDIVHLDIARGIDRHDVAVKVAERNDDSFRFADLIDPSESLIPDLGILAVNMTDDVARRMPWLRERGGVVVGALAADAPLISSGLQAGDVIYRVNRERVGSIDDLKRVMSTIVDGDAVVLEINRRGRYRYVALGI